MPRRHQRYVDALVAAVRVYEHDSRGPAPELSAFARTIADRAYAITDRDVESLKRAGHSDDRVFEVAVSAAVEAAVMRIDAAMAALERVRR